MSLEILIESPVANDSDKKHRNERTLEVIKKLNTEDEHLESTLFMLYTSEVLHNVLFYIPSEASEITSIHKLMRATVINKFLAIMDYILKVDKELEAYEIFCNMFFYLLTSEKFKLREKLQLLNRFFVLGGHQSTISMKSAGEKKKSRMQQLKSRVVLSEVLAVFLTFMTQPAKPDPSLKKMCYAIIFQSNVKLMEAADANLSYETMRLYIFIRFIDLTWKKANFDKAEVLSNTSVILATAKLRKLTIEPVFFKMLITLYTAAFTRLTIRGNELLKTSSTAILRSIAQVQTIDLNYLMWWKEMGKPKAADFKLAVTTFLSRDKLDQLEHLQQRQLALFDKSLMIDILLNPKTTIATYSNVSNILRNFASTSSSQDFEKLLIELKNIQRSQSNEKVKHREQFLLNILNLMIAYGSNVSNLKLKQQTGEILLKIFNEPSTSEYVKLATSEIVMSFINVDFNRHLFNIQ